MADISKERSASFFMVKENIHLVLSEETEPVLTRRTGAEKERSSSAQFLRTVTSTFL